MKRHSLNRMVIDTLSRLQQELNQDNLTAREVRDAIEQRYHIQYPIQTIIVVLNRFVTKGTVKRISYAGREVRQRYAYYLSQPSQEVIDEKMKDRFQSFADEFFEGDVKAALRGVQYLLQNPPPGFSALSEGAVSNVVARSGESASS
ncbi:MAG: BlaI/MecI/CopY family transcriptional regulator [Candidatus Melainabacteria bacterium]|nr:BlaI/MecI/CopY family transcriptional regulator [Candidatus Melainabacteria bacterium]